MAAVADLLAPADLAALALACRATHAALRPAVSRLRPTFLHSATLAPTYPGLRELDLSGVAASVTDASLAGLAALRQLSALSLSGCRKVRGPGLAALTDLPLARLDLSDAAALLDAGLLAAARMPLRTLLLQEASGGEGVRSCRAQPRAAAAAPSCGGGRAPLGARIGGGRP